MFAVTYRAATVRERFPPQIPRTFQHPRGNDHLFPLAKAKRPPAKTPVGWACGCKPPAEAWRRHFVSCSVPTLRGAYLRGAKAVSARVPPRQPEESAPRHPEAKLIPAGSYSPERRRDWTRRWRLNILAASDDSHRGAVASAGNLRAWRGAARYITMIEPAHLEPTSGLKITVSQAQNKKMAAEVF